MATKLEKLRKTSGAIDGVFSLSFRADDIANCPEPIRSELVSEVKNIIKKIEAKIAKSSR